MLQIRHALAALAAGASTAACGAAYAQTVGPPTDTLPAASTLVQAFTGGKPLLDFRARYEFVDQDKTAVLRENAEAYTLRSLFGWETAPWHGFQALAEGKVVSVLGPERFAVNVPGAATPPLNGADKTRFPLINDPRTAELNRLQLTWRPVEGVALTGGRQVLIVDDQRFVGDVSWRQDMQTFDAVRTDLSYGRFRLFYAYLTRVNRGLADERDWNSDSHLVNFVWNADPALQLEGFVYALDFKNSAANTSLTRGIKVSGAHKAGPVKLAYHLTYARQSDYRHATTPYGLDFWGLDLAATHGMVTGKVDWEVLEGNGTRGFTTPLATTHAFQGWADAWVQPAGGQKSFVDGLKDLNFTLDVKPPITAGFFSKPQLLVRYHDFKDQRTGAALAHEWDALLQATITPRVTAGLKFAEFQRESHVPAGTAPPPPSRTKVWFTLEFKL